MKAHPYPLLHIYMYIIHSVSDLSLPNAAPKAGNGHFVALPFTNECFINNTEDFNIT